MASEARVFFAIEASVSSSPAQRTLSLSDVETVGMLRAANPALFSASSGGKAEQVDKAGDARLANALASDTADNRGDLYLVLSPEVGGHAIGIKWRRVAASSAAPPSLGAALLSQGPVEIKVSSDPAGAPVQKWFKWKMATLVRAPKQKRPVAKAVAGAASSAAAAVSSDKIASKHSSDDLVELLHAVAETLSVLAQGASSSALQQTLRKTITALAESAAGCVGAESAQPQRRYPLRLVTVTKSRRDVALKSFNLEETDVTLSLRQGDNSSNSTSPGAVTFRSWNLEGAGSPELAARFVESCSKLVPGAVIASYPRFLADFAFSN